MFDACTTSRNFDRLPIAAQRSADEALKEREQRARATSEERSRKAADIAASASDRLRRLLGPDNYADLRQLMDRERLAVRDLLQPPQGLTSSFDDVNESRRQQADAFLRSHKVNREQLAEIRTDYHVAIADVLAADDKNITTGFHLVSRV
jgi:hypothetical protein